MMKWFSSLSFIFLLSFAVLGQSGNDPTVIEEKAQSIDEGYALAERSSHFGVFSVENLPNPKSEGQEYFVSNPNGILSSNTVNELNEIARRIENTTRSEYAIVIVDDYEGDSDFEFALSLFNKWGVGKKETNNGLLLFIAKNRHEYRFISGYGMESIFPDAYLKRVGEKYLVPNFRNDDYDEGVLEASEFIAQILTSADSKKELERMMPEASPFWSFSSPLLIELFQIIAVFILLYLYIHFVNKQILKGQVQQPKLFIPIFQGCGCMGILLFFSVFIFAFALNNLDQVYQLQNLPYFVLILFSIILAMKITEGRSKIKESFKDAEERDNSYKRYCKFLFVPMIITPLAWIDLLMISKTLIANKGRYIAPDSTGDWERIVRTATKGGDKGLLNQGQRNEERIGSRKYEIWRNKRDGNVELIPWEIKNKYKECPQCRFYTLEISATRTIRPATYSSSGEGERFDKCHNCSYRLDKGRFTISKKVRSSSSSGGGSSSSGGRSSSSGSFGGGSSGGGGAGGRW